MIFKILSSLEKLRSEWGSKTVSDFFVSNKNHLKAIAEPILGNYSNRQLESLIASITTYRWVNKQILLIVVKYLYHVRGRFSYIYSLPIDLVNNIPFLTRVQEDHHLFKNDFDVIHKKELDYTPVGHVLYISASSLLNSLNGYANRSHQIAKSIVEQGNTVTLLSFATKTIDELKERRIIDGVEYVTYYFSPQELQSGIISNSYYLSQFIETEARRNKSSVIHAGSNYENALPGFVASKKVGIPFIYEARGLWHYTKATLQADWQESERFKLAEKMEKLLMERADVVFSISSQLRNFITKKYSIEPSKVFLLKNSVPSLIGEFHKPQKKSEPFILGYLGSLTGYEGVDSLLEALSLAKKSAHSIKLRIGGEGVQRQGLEIHAKKLNLSTEVEFLGTINRDQIDDFYEQVDLMVYPRKSSQLTELIPPMKVLEPACFQTLTLTSNLAPIVEICECIPTIVTADLTTPKKILKNVLTIKKNFDTLQSQFKTFDFKEHTWKVQAKNYIKTLDTALSLELSSKPYLLPKKNILFASHDLKFIKFLLPLLEENYDVSISDWLGHNKAKDLNSEKSLAQNSDIIFCEWGLGNLVFHSREKKDNQVLITRIHAQEFRTDYLSRVIWNKVDHVILVSEVYKNNFLKLSRMSPEKISIIPNYSNPNIQFTPRSAPFRKIGLVGAIPRNKRLDLALELIEGLNSVSEDYELHILSKKPEELSWVKNNRSEMKYFKKCLMDLESLKKSGVKIFWHDFTDKPEEFYDKVDVVISVSDRESFHMTIADGLASGCFPAILEWPGARSIYDERFIRSNLTDLKDLIVSFSSEYSTNSVIEPLADEFKIDKVKQKFLSVLES